MAFDSGDLASREILSIFLLNKKRRSPGREGGFHQPRPALYRIRLNSQLRVQRTVLRFVSPVLFNGSPPQPLGSALSRVLKKLRGEFGTCLTLRPPPPCTPSAAELPSTGVLHLGAVARVRPVCRYSAEGDRLSPCHMITAQHERTAASAQRVADIRGRGKEEGGLACVPRLAPAHARSRTRTPHTVCKKAHNNITGQWRYVHLFCSRRCLSLIYLFFLVKLRDIQLPETATLGVDLAPTALDLYSFYYIILLQWLHH